MPKSLVTLSELTFDVFFALACLANPSNSSAAGATSTSSSLALSPDPPPPPGLIVIPPQNKRV